MVFPQKDTLGRKEGNLGNLSSRLKCTEFPFAKMKPGESGTTVRVEAQKRDRQILVQGGVFAWKTLHVLPLACRTSVGRTFPLRALTVLCCRPPLFVSLLCVLNGRASPLLMVKIEFLTGATLYYMC